MKIYNEIKKFLISFYILTGMCVSVRLIDSQPNNMFNFFEKMIFTIIISVLWGPLTLSNIIIRYIK